MTDVDQFPVVEPHGRNGHANGISNRDNNVYSNRSRRNDSRTDRSERTSVNRRRAARQPIVLHIDRGGPPQPPDVFIKENKLNYRGKFHRNTRVRVFPRKPRSRRRRQRRYQSTCSYRTDQLLIRPILNRGIGQVHGHNINNINIMSVVKCLNRAIRYRRTCRLLSS